MGQKACINLGTPQVPTAQMSGWQAKVEVGTGSEESLLWGSNPYFPDLLCALGARHFTPLTLQGYGTFQRDTASVKMPSAQWAPATCRASWGWVLSCEPTGTRTCDVCVLGWPEMATAKPHGPREASSVQTEGELGRNLVRQVGHHPQAPSVPCRGQARGAQAQFHLSPSYSLDPWPGPSGDQPASYRVH